MKGDHIIPHVIISAQVTIADCGYSVVYLLSKT